MDRFVITVAALALLSTSPANAEDAFVRFTGTQKVRLSCYPDKNSRIEIDCALEDITTPQQRFFQCGTADDLNCHLYLNSGCKYALNYDKTKQWKDSGIPSTTERTTIIVDSKQDQFRIVTKNGTVTNVADSVFDFMTQRDTPSSSGVLLGGDGSNPIAKMKVYGVRFYDDGVETHRYEPRLCGTVAGLYDMIGNDGFVYDSRSHNTDDYMLGSGGEIKELGAIRSLGPDGKHYGLAGVNTRIIPSLDLRFEIDYAYDDINKVDNGGYQQRLFGAGGNLMLQSYINGSGNIGIGYGKEGDSTAVYSGFGKPVDTRPHRLIVDYLRRKACYMTGVETNFTMTLTEEKVAGLSGSDPIALFNWCLMTSGLKFATDGTTDINSLRYGSKSRVYRVRAYRADVLEHEYVPLVKGGVPGFRDLVDGAFITGENVDMLTTVGEVESVEDDGYVELTGNKGLDIKTASVATESKFISLSNCPVKPGTRVELDCALAENFVKCATNDNQFAYFTCYYKDSTDNYVERFYFLGPGYTDRAKSQRSYAYRLGTGSETIVTTDYDLAANKGRNVRRTLILDSPGKQAVIVTAGFTNIVKSTGADTIERTTTTFLRLGANFNPGLYAPLKVYGCKVYEDDVLVHNYVPCVKNGFAGLRDTLSADGTVYADGQAEVSKGSGRKQLTPGGAISGDPNWRDAYLEFDGNEIIDTGYKPKRTTRIEMDLQLLQNNYPQQRLWQAEGGITAHLYMNSGNKFAFKWSTGTDWLGGMSFATLERVTVIVDAKNAQTRIVLDGGATTNSYDTLWPNMVGYSTTDCTGNLYIGGATNWDSGNPHARMRLFGFRIYEDGVLQRDYVPYKSPDGTKIGLYDCASATGEVKTNYFADKPDSAFTVGGMSATLLVEPVDTNVPPRESATLTACAATAVSYKWYKDGKEIPGETGPSLTVVWRKGKPYEETISVRPVYSVFGTEVLGDAASAVVTHGRLGMSVIVR